MKVILYLESNKKKKKKKIYMAYPNKCISVYYTKILEISIYMLAIPYWHYTSSPIRWFTFTNKSRNTNCTLALRKK